MLAARLGNEIFRRFLMETMNRLMESDRLLIKDNIYLYIGTPRNRTVVKARKKKLYGVASGPYKRHYGVVLDGIGHRYFFRMPFRRRKELAERIKGGQHFYHTPWL